MSSSKSPEEQTSELLCLKASELELTEGPDKALETIGPPSDQIRMKTVLGILIRAKRYPDAADLVQTSYPHQEWIHLGVFALARTGETARAQELVNISDRSGDLRATRLARLAFAQGMLDGLLERTEVPSLLAPRQWSDVERADIALVGVVLEPIVSLVRANRKIDSELQLEAITCALTLSHIAGDTRAFDECQKWLVEYVPVPLVIGELCLRGAISPLSNLSTRLRIEHAGDFQASLLAALVDRELLGDANGAFDSLVALAKDTMPEEQKEAVASAIFETAGWCGQNNIAVAIETIQKLLPQDTRLVTLLRAFEDILSDEIGSATSRLESARDESDPSWWQAYAILCERTNKEEDARDAWENASRLLPHPDLIRRAAQASLDRRAYQSAVTSLEELAKSGNASDKDIEALAWSLVQLRDFAKAAHYLRRLLQGKPRDTSVRLSLAQCLAQSANLEEAIQVLEETLDDEDVPLDAYLLQSECLVAADRANEAFELLESVAGDHWDDARFLMGYMNVAHYASRDREAFDAFSRLHSLQREGTVPSEYLHEKTLEDLLKYGEEFRKRRESLQKEIIGGRMPWLFVEDVMGNPPHWAWTLHTQSLKWLPDDSFARATYTVYATNGFTTGGPEGKKRLQRIVGVPQGSKVVADLSALLTLDRLGRLGEVEDYFAHVFLPSTYGELRVHDERRFGLHQPSREKELIQIREQIDRGSIRILAGDMPDKILDEYSDQPTQNTYHLQDLLALLQKLQILTDDELHLFSLVSHKAALAGGDRAPLEAGMNLSIDLLTLRTLAGQDCFERLVSCCNLHISPLDREQVHSELLAYKTAHDARDSHSKFWDTILKAVNHGKFSWATVPRDTESPMNTTRELVADQIVHLDSIYLARAKGLPLLADDRVLQVMYSQYTQSTDRYAFGVDRLLEGFLEEELVDITAFASDFHKLMKWRYRFLIPSPRILSEWASQSQDNLPGDMFLDAASYLHDSLRDQGLLCGLEDSDPPMPMAAKLTTAWIDAISKFLAMLWLNPKYSNDQASQLTTWIGEEMLPSCPRGLWFHPVGHNLARFEAESVVRMAMVQFTTIEDADRANLGLRVLAGAIGMTEEEFALSAVEAIDAVS